MTLRIKLRELSLESQEFILNKKKSKLIDSIGAFIHSVYVYPDGSKIIYRNGGSNQQEILFYIVDIKTERTQNFLRTIGLDEKYIKRGRVKSFDLWPRYDMKKK